MKFRLQKMKFSLPQVQSSGDREYLFWRTQKQCFRGSGVRQDSEAVFPGIGSTRSLRTQKQCFRGSGVSVFGGGSGGPDGAEAEVVVAISLMSWRKKFV